MILTLFACLSVTALHAMTPTCLKEEIIPSHLVLNNTTSWRLLALYTTRTYNEPAGLTLLPNEEAYLEDIDSIVTLKIVPSGKNYGMLQYRDPQELIETLTSLIKPPYHDHIQITIAMPHSSPLQYVSAFKYHLLQLSHDLLRAKLAIPESNLVKDAFPEVKDAHKRGKAAFARHYLGISLSSKHITETLPSLYEAFQRRTRRWQRLAPENPIFVQQVLQLLDNAYTVLNEELTLKKLLSESGITLPVTLKTMISQGTNEELHQASFSLLEQWQKAPISAPLKTKIIEHMRSELELLETEDLLNCVIPPTIIKEEELAQEEPILSPKDEQIIDFLLNPETLKQFTFYAGRAANRIIHYQCFDSNNKRYHPIPILFHAQYMLSMKNHKHIMF